MLGCRHIARWPIFALEQTSMTPVSVIWLGVTLAMLAAFAYVLIGSHILAVGDLQLGNQS